MNIPKTSILCKKENGVAWYADSKDANVNHYMQFDGRVLSGAWVGPQWVFLALTLMTVEERAAHVSHDEMMGAINVLLQKRGGFS